MVPHIKVEQTVNEILEGQDCVVTAIPDEQKGERLVVLFVKRDVTPDNLWNQLAQTDLPKLWLPKRENLYAIESIPTLSTGKVDLRKVKAIALEKSSDAKTAIGP